MKKTDPVIKARNKLCYSIADQIIKDLKQDGHLIHPHLIDIQHIAEGISIWLPLSYVEAQAEWDNWDKEEKERKRADSKPSILDELRQALGYDSSISLRGTLQGAIEIIRQHRNQL